MPQRRQVQYQQIAPQEANLGDYSALAQQFLRKKDKPIYSAEQGIAEVLGDVGEAYFMRKAAEKDQKRQDRDLSAVAMAQQFASNPNLTRVNVNDALGQERTIANSVFDRPADPNERYAGAMAQIQDNPRAQIAAGPGVMDLAKQFAPKEKKYSAPVAAMGPDNKPVFIRPEEGGAGYETMQGVAPPAPQKQGQWAISAADGKPKFVSEADLLSATGNYLPVPTGMRVTSDGNGGFEITTGGMEPKGITKPTETKLEDTILTGRDALARMSAIKAKAKPEYQQLSARWANTWAGIKDKAGIQLDPTTKQQLSEFTSYRRDVAANLNQTIKDLTGATVGEAEAPRLMQQIPVAGQGLFDGDGPVEFDAKLKGATDAITSSIARAEYARKNGLDKKQMFAIPLDSIPQLIEQKGNTYADELSRANPQAPPEQIQEMVKTRLREEFGL